MQVKDIMTPDVVTVSPRTSIEQVATLLLEKRISAVPVVTKNNKIVGIVSEGDLAHRLDEDLQVDRSWWLKMVSTKDTDYFEYIKTHGRHAEDVMTKNVVTVDEEMCISEVAHLLETRHIKRVPVVREAKLCGIVSRANLLQALVSGKKELTTPTSNDRELREAIYQEINSHQLTRHGGLNVIVEKGEVELWGWIESEPERQALMLAAREVNGVNQVHDHLGTVAPWIWNT